MVLLMTADFGAGGFFFCLRLALSQQKKATKKLLAIHLCKKPYCEKTRKGVSAKYAHECVTGITKKSRTIPARTYQEGTQSKAKRNRVFIG